MSDSVEERTKRINSWLVAYCGLPSNATVYFLEIAAEIRAAVEAARADEREACAKLVDSPLGSGSLASEVDLERIRLADRIRARGRGKDAYVRNTPSVSRRRMMTERTTSDHYESVRAFMVMAGQKVRSGKPVIPPEDERMLRAKLILEEALETIEALGLCPTLDADNAVDGQVDITMDLVSWEDTSQGPNLTEIADGCADLSVVTIGTLIACGIPDLHLLRIVDQANMAKFGPGGHRREDGKWIKPPGFTPPDIAGFLASL